MKRIATARKTFDHIEARGLGRALPRGARLSKVIPDKDPLDLEPKTTTIRIGRKLLAQIDSVAEEENISRNDVLIYFLKWALREYRTDQRTPKQQG